MQTQFKLQLTLLVTCPGFPPTEFLQEHPITSPCNQCASLMVRKITACMERLKKDIMWKQAQVAIKTVRVYEFKENGIGSKLSLQFFFEVEDKALENFRIGDKTYANDITVDGVYLSELLARHSNNIYNHHKK